VNSQTDKSFRILIVDDDPALRSGLSTLLTLSGYNIEAASNTISALRLLDDNFYHLVITDILMPGESGLSLIQNIKHFDPSIKIIAISGGGKSKALGLLNIAKKFGAVRVLKKPILTTKLLDIIQEVLES